MKYQGSKLDIDSEAKKIINNLKIKFNDLKSFFKNVFSGKFNYKNVKKIDLKNWNSSVKKIIIKIRYFFITFYNTISSFFYTRTSRRKHYGLPSFLDNIKNTIVYDKANPQNYWKNRASKSLQLHVIKPEYNLAHEQKQIKHIWNKKIVGLFTLAVILIIIIIVIVVVVHKIHNYH